MEYVSIIAAKLEQLHSYYYSVERYLAGLKRLTILARPMSDTDTPVYITFIAVKYIQMPTYWQGAPFKLATPDECKSFLESIDIEIVDSLPTLFYVQFPKSRAHVICWNIEISDTMPPGG